MVAAQVFSNWVVKSPAKSSWRSWDSTDQELANMIEHWFRKPLHFLGYFSGMNVQSFILLVYRLDTPGNFFSIHSMWMDKRLSPLVFIRISFCPQGYHFKLNITEVKNDFSIWCIFGMDFHCLTIKNTPYPIHIWYVWAQVSFSVPV